ncbi:MAG: radical SAM protein, partial [Acidobacteria bacterium]
MKPWQQRERARDVLAREVGHIRKQHGGRLRVALAFPNTYYLGMSNLGFQTVYDIINRHPACLCERVFLPDPEEDSRNSDGFSLLSIESQRPLTDFDMIA